MIYLWIFVLMKHRKIIFFIKLKIIIGLSNLLCIHASALIFVDMSGLTKVQKYFKEILKWLWNKRKEN